MSKYTDFYYNFPTLIFFGENSVNNLIQNKILDNYGNILIVTAGEFVHQFGAIRTIKNHYPNTNFIVEDTSFYNPSVKDVSCLRDKYKDSSIDFIIAIGGGSVIDACKLLALSINSEDPITDILVNNKTLSNIVPIGTICTVPASGSEANSSFVIVDDNNKKWARANQNIRPVFCVLNRDFVKTLPKKVLKASLSDIMSHLLEQYLSGNPETTFIDDLIIGAINNLIRNQDEVLKGNLDALEDIMLCATFTLSYFLSMGKKLDWNVHEIEHGISGLYKTSHGERLSVLFPKYLKHPKVQSFFKDRLEYLNDSINRVGGINSIYNYFHKLIPSNYLLDSDEMTQILNIILNGRETIGQNVILNRNDIYEIINS